MQKLKEAVVTAADMALISRVLPFTDPAHIPLTFKWGDRTVKGIPASFRPTVTRRLLDCNIAQYVIEGRRSGLYVRVEYLEYRDFPVTEWVAYLKNEGKTDTAVISDVRLGGVVSGKHAVLTHGNGDTCNDTGYHFTDTPLDAPLTLSPVSATSCQGAFPYMTLRFPDCEVRAAIGWPTRWIADIAPVRGGVSFLCGQNRCHTVLRPGETWRTPRLNLMIYKTFAGDSFRGINLWRRWYLKHILPRENGQPIAPQLCLHNHGADGKPEMTGATEENQISALREYVRRGMKPDIWWFDAGWYKCDFDWPRTGSWHPDPARFPNGFKPLGEECDKYGVKLLLWFEPERVRAGQELDTEHPDWVLWQHDANGNRVGADGILDLSNPEALAYITKHVNGIIKEGHIRIYRQDFNFDPAGIWVSNESPDRVGSIENRHAQGYLAYWDDILFENPGLWIDSCASGGRRNDLETMRRAVPLHYTDVGYGIHPIKQKQHREMFEWIPYFRAHNMNWDNAQTATYENGGRPVDRFAFQCALTPSLTNMITYGASDEQYRLGIEMDALWRKAAEIELTGDYYPMTECRQDAHDWYAMQFDDAEHNRGFVQVIRNIQVAEDTFTVLLPCVHEGKTYTFTNREDASFAKTYTAKELQKGFTVTLPHRTGVVLFYTTED